MKLPQTINTHYLSALTTKIQTAPPDEASIALLEASTIILLAGFPELAYQGFWNLTQGDLKLSESSSLARFINEVLPALCYFLECPCPAFFSNEERSQDQLEDYMQEVVRQHRLLPIKALNRYYQQLLQNELKEPMMELQQVMEELQAQETILEFQQSMEELQAQIAEIDSEPDEVVDDKDFNIPLSFESPRGSDDDLYDDDQKVILEIQESLRQNDINRADQKIQIWWRSLNEHSLSERLRSALYLLPHWPDMMHRVASGALRGALNIPEKNAQDCIDLIQARSYDHLTLGAIPSVEDWRALLTKWNDKMFQYFEDEKEDRDYVQSQYPDEFEKRSFLRPGATEAEVTELETKLKTKLPSSYRNFLLASNGFNIANYYRVFYGTNDYIQWFIDENEDWIEDWEEGDDDVDDETYFQYGEHQDCCNIRAKYMRTALQISDHEEGDVFLLNQEIIDPRNEWEAWDFGFKNPGAYRYRSFWDMAQALCEECSEW